MPIVELCPACAGRIRPGDAWCAMCYAPVLPPDSRATTSPVSADPTAEPVPPGPVPPGPVRRRGSATGGSPADAALSAAIPGERVMALAEAMIAELAAGTTDVGSLPGLDGVLRLAGHGAPASERRGRRIAVLAGGFVLALGLGLALLWAVGLAL